MDLYPRARETRTDPKWGSQKFGKVRDPVTGKDTDEDYEPVALDSEGAAATRMLTAIEAQKRRNAVIAAGLAGSDEVGTVNAILDKMVAEARTWAGVSPVDHYSATDFKAALKGDYLDPQKWYDGLKAEKGVSTFAELKAAFTPVGI